MKKTTTPTNLIGTNFTIPAGTRVTCNSTKLIQKRTSTVTVVDQEITNSGKTRIVWHRGNRRATALLG
jgi:hypothetical protein